MGKTWWIERFNLDGLKSSRQVSTLLTRASPKRNNEATVREISVL
jgi:hypothetical protein